MLIIAYLNFIGNEELLSLFEPIYGLFPFFSASSIR